MLFLLGFCGEQVGINGVWKVCTAAFRVLREGGCVEQIGDKGHVLPLKKWPNQFAWLSLGKKTFFNLHLVDHSMNVSSLYVLHNTHAQEENTKSPPPRSPQL